MRRLTALGLWLVLGGIVLQVVAGITSQASDGDDIVLSGIFSSLGGTAIFAGIIVLIVSAVRGRGQQQQQQVIIHLPATPMAPVQQQCPACQGLTPAGHAFCAQCGASLGGVASRPQPAGASRATATRAAPTRATPAKAAPRPATRNQR